MAGWLNGTAAKQFAWRGAMQALKEDESIPAHVQALIELLDEDRRELLQTQQRMVGVLEKLEKKVDAMASALEEHRMHNERCRETADRSSASADGCSVPGPSSANHSTSRRKSEPGRSANGLGAMPSGDQNGGYSNEDIVFPIVFHTNEMTKFEPRSPQRDGDAAEEEGGGGGCRVDIAMASSPSSSIGGGLQQILAQFPFNLSESRSPEQPITSRPPTKRKRHSIATDGVSSGVIAGGGGATESSVVHHVCRFPGCQHEFENEEELRAHVAHHTPVCKHHCPMCGLAIKAEARLRDHINQHTGERPYSCDHCGRGFSRLDAKGAHQKRCLERLQTMQPSEDCVVVGGQAPYQ